MSKSRLDRCSRLSAVSLAQRRLEETAGIAPGSSDESDVPVSLGVGVPTPVSFELGERKEYPRRGGRNVSSVEVSRRKVGSRIEIQETIQTGWCRDDVIS